jgi:GT2 family glycosyltransferase
MPDSADLDFPLVVSVVVNYNGLQDTRKCVRTLLASAYPRQRVVVVDNGSQSSEASAISAEFGDRVEVVVSRANLGYGGGANLGLRWAIAQDATYAWVLNNDTTVDPGCIGELTGAMESNARYGILSPWISAPVGPEAPSGIWFSGGRVLLARAETRHLLEPAQGRGPLDSEYVTGCAMFIRCGALAETGLFWERLFLFWEDVDLSLRMRRAGWRLGVVPATHIRHEIHGSIASATQDYFHFRNAPVVVGRFATPGAALSGLAFLMGGVARRWARAFLRRRPAPIAATRGLLVGLVLAVKWHRAPVERAPAERAAG